MRNLNFSGCFQDAFLHLYFSCSSVICIVLGVLWFFLFVIQSISWMNIVFTLYTHNFSSFLWFLLKITKAWAPSLLSEGLLGLSLFFCSIVFLWFGRISPARCSYVAVSTAKLTQPVSFPYFLLLSLLFLCWNFLYFCFFFMTIHNCSLD